MKSPVRGIGMAMSNDSEQYRPAEKKLLMVASTGGHLEQLYLWSTQWQKIEKREFLWVTFETSQSTSLLAGQNVSFIPYVAPRDWRAGLRSLRPLTRIIRTFRPDRVISTGAGVAVAGFLAAATVPIPCTYIESLARVNKFSVTGRVVSRFPGVERYVQHSRLKRRGWSDAGSIVDAFSVHTCSVRDPHMWRILLTVGTIRPYGFDRLLRTLDGLLEPRDEVVWQIGNSVYRPNSGDVRTNMARHELMEKAEWADVIVSHAGVGSILSALQAGKVPIVVPRRREYGEHVDDHQIEIAEFVSTRGLGLQVEADELTRDHLVRAAGLRCAPS